MDRPRVLVAGVGNIFLGDDAFGVEVVRRLSARPMPEGVRVIDFGIRGLDLTYALLDGYETVVLVDATPRGGRPGALYVIDVESAGDDGGPPALDMHGMDPVRVLRLAASMGGRVGRLLVVGCEPEPCDEDEMRLGMSEPVKAAVAEAVGVVESLVGEALGRAG